MAEEEEAVFRILSAASPVSAIVSGRIFPDRSNGAVAPYVIYSRIAGVADNLLEGGATHDRIRIQVDCYAATKTAAKALGLACRNALEAELLNLGANPSNFDESTKLYGDSRDYSLISIR
jgi:hypothetical protein